jgi:hypothetical protein
MGGMVSCGRSMQVAANENRSPEYVDQMGAQLNKGSGAINSLTEAQLEEFRAAFNSFDEECVTPARRSVHRSALPPCCTHKVLSLPLT